ncbi:unnamed protein product, partial [Rotaria socialis]
QLSSSFHNSQYEGFHWDLYENPNYHQLTFEHNKQKTRQEKSLLEWSMDLKQIDRISSTDRQQTSWHEIKCKSSNHSNSSS